MALAPQRQLFRHVFVEGISFFSDQGHLRLHCRVNLAGKVVHAGLHADYQLLNSALNQLPSEKRMAISARIGEALAKGGKRWNFIEVDRILEDGLFMRRCLVESIEEENESNRFNPLKIKALSI